MLSVLKKPKYYLEVVRIWNASSYYVPQNCMLCSGNYFLIKKRHLFKKDEIVKTFFYTKSIEDALDYLRELNGSDYTNNNDAIKEYGFHHFVGEDGDTNEIINSKND